MKGGWRYDTTTSGAPSATTALIPEMPPWSAELSVSGEGR